MRALPRDVYDLEPRSRYENEEPVLACRETVSWGGNCQSLLTGDGNTWLGWAAKLFKEVEITHIPMGDYEVVSHTETPECSLRLLKLAKDKFVSTCITITRQPKSTSSWKELPELQWMANQQYSSLTKY